MYSFKILQIFSSFSFLISISGLKSLLLSFLIIICLCSLIFVYKCQHYFFLLLSFAFHQRRTNQAVQIFSALIHCRVCTHPTVQSSKFKGAPAIDTMSELERTLCWMTCFQHGSLISPRVISITQDILCVLIVVAVFSFLCHSLFSTVRVSTGFHACFSF